MLLGSFVPAYDESDTRSSTDSTTSSTSQDSNETATPEDMRQGSAFLVSHASGGTNRHEILQSPTQMLPRRQTDEALPRSRNSVPAVGSSDLTAPRNRSVIRHESLR